MTLRRLHRTLALCLAAFIGLHLINHVMIIFGTDSHIAMMDTLRLIYRNPVIETVIIAGFALQIGVGVRLMWRRGKPRHFWGWMQAGSGVIFAVFLVQHTSAVLMTRWSYPEMSTDVLWAASVVSQPILAAYFAPYYTLGVAALFVHIGAIFALRRRPRIAWALVVSGGVVGVAIVAGLMGAFGPVELLSANKAYLISFWGLAE